MEGDNSHTPEVGEGLPPQLHAGRVGYGPNYHPDPTIEEKISGLKDELKGKIKHDPELVKHGRSIRSGEEKRKKMAGEDEANPFQSASDDSEAKSSKSSGVSSTQIGTQDKGHGNIEKEDTGRKASDTQSRGEAAEGVENIRE